jgi:ribosome biogenesis SPOUT family RNA methylase Rps3
VALNGLSPWQSNLYRGFEIMKMARRAATPRAVPDRCSPRHVGASLTVIDAAERVARLKSRRKRITAVDNAMTAA